MAGCAKAKDTVRVDFCCLFVVNLLCVLLAYVCGSLVTATQAADLRSHRMVVVVSSAEKRRIAGNAAAAGMTVSDFMRAAADRYTEPTATEQALIRDLLAQEEAASTVTDSAMRKLEVTRARAASFGEDQYREQVCADFLARDDIDRPALGALIGARA